MLGQERAPGTIIGEPVDRPIDPTLALEAAPLPAAPSRGLTSRTPAASQRCPSGGAALTFSDAALLGREAQLLQHRGHTRGIHWQSYSPANRGNALVKATFRLVELRGLEPLTFSLRTRRATDCAIAPRIGVGRSARRLYHRQAEATWRDSPPASAGGASDAGAWRVCCDRPLMPCRGRPARTR